MRQWGLGVGGGPLSSDGSFCPEVFSSPSAKGSPLVSLSITECYKHFCQAESRSGWHPVSLICLPLQNVGRGGVHPHPVKQRMKIETAGSLLGSTSH